MARPSSKCRLLQTVLPCTRRSLDLARRCVPRTDRGGPHVARFHKRPYATLFLGILTEHRCPRKSTFTALLADPMLSPGVMGSADQPRPTHGHCAESRHKNASRSEIMQTL